MQENKTLSLKKDQAETGITVSEQEELRQLREEKKAREEKEAVLIEAQKKFASRVTLNLPPAAGRSIKLAGVEYVHGHSYDVTNDVKWALEEAERRCWAHEASLHESENKGRAKRRAFVG